MHTFEFLPPGSHNPKFGIRPGVIFGKPMEFSRYYGKEKDRDGGGATDAIQYRFLTMPDPHAL